MTRADVSVIVATYRREKLLLEAIASARSQRGVEVEVVVVDDSPEGSARDNVLSLNDPRVRYIHRPVPSNGRPGAVRNEGVIAAQAPLLHFLDDDDRLFEGCLYDLARTIGSGGHPFAFGRVVPFGDDVRIRETEGAYFKRVASDLRRIRGRRWFAAQLLFRDMPFVNSACMMTRDAFDAHGGYDATLRCCEDVDLFLRVGRANGFKFVDRDVLHYRVGSPSIMNEIRRAAREAARVMTYESYAKIHTLYKREHGMVEYRALQIFARGCQVLQFLPA
jgi:glycosyltransferase involved in cell wall biosynthesis